MKATIWTDGSVATTTDDGTRVPELCGAWGEMLPVLRARGGVMFFAADNRGGDLVPVGDVVAGRCINNAGPRGQQLLRRALLSMGNGEQVRADLQRWGPRT